MLIQTQEIAAEYGPTLSISVQDCSQMQDENGAQKKFGFVSFENHEDAEKCVQEMNGKEYGDRKLYVSRAQKKVIIVLFENIVESCLVDSQLWFLSLSYDRNTTYKRLF